ncbi:MAG TPA: PIG-L family deacetylase [Terriglobales bacterium]|nr:PIG-L family deacetylase [Terriglobales bacterium]
MKLRHSFCLLTLFVATLAAQTPKSSPATEPDDRLKADVLLVVAHPDDETGVSAYLAQLLEQHKRVAAVYLTRGEAGHNNMGPERATALGAVRELELRHAMTKFGIDNVWILDGRDTPSQNVLQSLAQWHHGAALEEVVRMVRLTRPEVILTWLPGFFIGENHGDHQAAGVLATEAFDIAGDPSVFPAQLAGPVRINETLLEGLRPWQPKKIYYFSDAQEQEQFKNSGPLYPVTGISPVRKLPYWRIALEAFEFHLTQYRSYIEGLGKMNEQQLAKEGADNWSDPVQLTFGKSNVGGSVTGDVFEGITSAEVAFARRAEEAPELPSGLSVELAGPWGFYETFRRAHALQHLPRAAVPEIAITSGATLQIPLFLRNNMTSSKEIALSLTAPEGWVTQSGIAGYMLRAGDQLPVTVTLTSPKTAEGKVDEIACRAQADGQTISTIKLHVRRRSGGLPQY